MKILITGANGYLGTGIVKQLCEDRIKVIATDIHTDLVDSRAEKVNCDLFSVENPYIFFGKPDVMLHLAWKDGFVHNKISHIENIPKHFEFIKKMISGDDKHFENIQEMNHDTVDGCRRIAVMGTMHEIGFYEGCIKENTPTHPESLYGISKDSLRNMTELLCRQSGAIFQWLRGYYIVGNSEHGSSIFSKITLAEKLGQEKFPFTLGLNQWDFIDYDEFCRDVAYTVEQDEINGIINICNGRPEKLSDRVERFIRDNGYNIKLDYGKYPDRPYDSKAVWGDDTKIKEILRKRENSSAS